MRQELQSDSHLLVAADDEGRRRGLVCRLLGRRGAGLRGGGRHCRQAAVGRAAGRLVRLHALLLARHRVEYILVEAERNNNAAAEGMRCSTTINFVRQGPSVAELVPIPADPPTSRSHLLPPLEQATSLVFPSWCVVSLSV